MREFKVGDVVRVVNATCTFGDYQNGDTARLDRVDAAGDWYVEWISRNPESRARGKPCYMLHAREFEHASSIDEEIEEFVSGYEFYGEDAEGREGTYAPNERERRLITDAILGWVSR